MAELLGVDVVNSSMYDWASALAEAARMTWRLTDRTEIVIPRYISPERREVLLTYSEPVGMKVVDVAQSRSTGQIDVEDLKKKVTKNTAGVYIENPSYLGFVETNPKTVSEVAHDVGALFLAGVEPLSLGILQPPGEYGADIVVGEGQPLGNSMNFGGPQLGILGCRIESKIVRAMPGRLIGLSTTQDNSDTAYAMILQTREQHIRREKATSNICTNQALLAVTAAAHLSLLGKNGLRMLAEHILAKTKYAVKSLASVHDVESPVFNAPHFKEFTFRLAKGKAGKVLAGLLDHRIIGGKDVSSDFPELGETVVSCVTEIHSKESIDRFSSALNEVLR